MRYSLVDSSQIEEDKALISLAIEINLQSWNKLFVEIISFKREVCLMQANLKKKILSKLSISILV